MDIILILFLFVIACIAYYTIYKRRKIYQDPLIKKIKYDVSKLDPRIDSIDFFSVITGIRMVSKNFVCGFPSAP